MRALVTEGPGAVRRLINLGARFDTDPAGRLELTREGGHLRDRIAHAGGDATGAEISRALVAAVSGQAGIELVENALALDLLTAADGAAQGITLHVMGEGQRGGVGAALAPAVVLATGGLGQVFSATTNPSVATGDGIGLALRAGAEVADLEFVQFHPTVLWIGRDAVGQQPLVSEAVRGEGAVLVDDAGERFLVGQHPLAELAPRDVVAKAIMRRMRETGAPHVWLDGRSLGAAAVGAPVPHDPRLVPCPRRRPRDRAGPRRAGAALCVRGRTYRRPTGAPPCRGCSRAGSAPAPGCTARTGSPRTRCWKAWSSRRGSGTILAAGLPLRREPVPHDYLPGLLSTAVPAARCRRR